MLGLLITAAFIFQPDGVLRDSCDIADDNFFFDEYGRLVFEQHVFIDLVDGEERIVDWRLVKEPRPIVHDRQCGGYVVRWIENERLREVRAASTRQTFLQFDFELAAREKLRVEQRRRLRGEP